MPTGGDLTNKRITANLLPDVIVVDTALAHTLPDRDEAAYRRTDFLNRRRQLMHTWALYAEGTPHIS